MYHFATSTKLAVMSIGVVSMSASIPNIPITCNHYADTGLPCLEISRCSSGHVSTTEINQLSNGLGSSVSTSDISLCFDDVNLYVNVTANKQSFLENPGYIACNDAIFNADVAEMFIAPNMEEVNHCYNELDISPFDVQFDAGIYNPNLNATGIVGSEFPCDNTGIQHMTAVDMTNSNWEAFMSYSWELLNCPYNCPLKQYCGHVTPNNVYRVNFFRINELVPTSSCTSSTCEYMAWSPTMRNPPAFHEPTKFGYLVLQL